MKKIIVAFFILICMYFCTTLTAFAYTEGYFEYKKDNGSIVITGYFGNESEVTVPSMIAGNPVSTIGKGAFTSSGSITKINLPDTVTAIESGAIDEEIVVIFDSNTNTPYYADGTLVEDTDDIANDTISEIGTDTNGNKITKESNNQSNIDDIADGGWVDEDTLSDEINKKTAEIKISDDTQENSEISDTNKSDTTAESANELISEITENQSLSENTTEIITNVSQSESDTINPEQISKKSSYIIPITIIVSILAICSAGFFVYKRKNKGDEVKK
jgi:hypothetical protein